jgi:AcrR family transcriptional regulator
MLIVDAAAGLFVSEGYARTTVRAIAERAGVAQDTVYRPSAAK